VGEQEATEGSNRSVKYICKSAAARSNARGAVDLVRKILARSRWDVSIKPRFGGVFAHSRGAAAQRYSEV
jgi:hypothetical protein